jgi:hypothetical protein
MGWIVLALLVIVAIVILYYVIRTAVRDGITDAWRIRNRVEKDAAAEQAVGWDPQTRRGR